MASYDSTKICYRYNPETYIYEGVEYASLDLHSLRTSKTPKYELPENCTFVEPPVVDDYGVPLLEENELIVFNSILENWNILKQYEPEKPKLVKSSDVVYSDMNTRFMDYKEDKFLTSDAKAVFQSIYRLITTDAGEIPYYRSYGCNLKRFIQKPLTEQTANLIYDYLKDKVEKFEPRGRIVSSEVGADLNNNILRMKLYVQCIATGETGVVPDLYVKVNRNRR